MTAELLAQNVAAHWLQAGAVAAIAWLGVAVLRLREPSFLLRYWQAVLLLLLFAPWIQPWQPVAAPSAPGSPSPASFTMLGTSSPAATSDAHCWSRPGVLIGAVVASVRFLAN